VEPRAPEEVPRGEVEGMALALDVQKTASRNSDHSKDNAPAEQALHLAHREARLVAARNETQSLNKPSPCAE